jgi:membrane-associated protein
MTIPWRELIHQIYNVQELIEWGGTVMVCAIVFVETGLFVGFFLPGDSLLVAAGVFAAAGHLSLHWLLMPVSLCAIAGDQLGYWIGRRAGMSLYRRPDSRFFKKVYLQRAHAFYESHGGRAIIIARFIPIVRTFCPPVAGAAQMTYRRYLSYDIFGGVFWVCGMVLAGFLLGTAIPHIDNEIHWVIAAVIFLSLLPPIIQVLRMRAEKRSAARTQAPTESR